MNRLIRLGQGDVPPERLESDSDAAQAETKEASIGDRDWRQHLAGIRRPQSTTRNRVRPLHFADRTRGRQPQSE